MNILFLTLLDFSSFDERNIYCDLLRDFIKNGHNVYCISPTEQRNRCKTHWEENEHLLKLSILNTQKTQAIKKGISVLCLEKMYINAIKKYFSDIHFDLVLYSTPPITLCKAIEFVKKRDNAKTYLLLKDIFPQNAVDLGMMTTNGVKGLIYKYFRNLEKRLYCISDKIGCMSQANVDYILTNNPEIDPSKVEICPNSTEVHDLRLDSQQKISMRAEYGIPTDKKIFIYGGNFGKPQGIDFLIECLDTLRSNDDVFVLVVGSGTEYDKLKEFFDKYKPSNMLLMCSLPKIDFDDLVAVCDVGMIFLDYRFTIPNFPSRILSYMQAGLPVLACTDTASDVKEVLSDGDFGWWCESNNSKAFTDLVSHIVTTDDGTKAQNSYQFLVKKYDVGITSQTIMSAFKNKQTAEN